MIDPPKTTSASDQPVTLHGVVARITYQNQENGYAVVRLKAEDAIALPRGASATTKDGLLTVVGIMPGLAVGESAEFVGEWIHDSKFGTQFKARSFKPRLPTGARGIEAYLASGAVKGVGPVTAKRIVAQFGDETFRVLDEAPERLKEVEGLRGKGLAKVLAGWRSATGDRELVTFLGDHGIAPGVAARLRRVYHENALAVVRANPYRLTTDVRGIGFTRADAIARQIGLAVDAPERLDAALAHVLERAADDGHTCLPRSELEARADELLRLERADAADVIAGRVDDGLQRKRLIEEMLPAPMATGEMGGRTKGDRKALYGELPDGENTDGQPSDEHSPGAQLKRDIAELEGAERTAFIFTPLLHDAETRCAVRLKRLGESAKTLPRIDAVAALADFEQRAQIGLAPAQREAVLTMARRGMMIMTGGPGTGKTTTVRSAIELFTLGRLTVKLAAPTGRAARRLSESGRLPAETIHRLLGYQAPLGKFGRDAQSPIEADLVIIDEASMLDAPLAAHLLEALAPRTCLMLVGDEDQLPSVGPGNILSDLIASQAMPIVRLNQIFRQAGESLIVTNAHRINHGEMPLNAPYNAAPPESPQGRHAVPDDPDVPNARRRPSKAAREADFFFIERDNPFEIIATIKTLVRERIPRRFHLDPHRDVQVLSPMRRGELGVEALNGELKDLLNRSQASDGPAQLRLAAENAEDVRGARGTTLDIGDRVMQISNNYDKLVSNGDIGFVAGKNAETRELIVDFYGRSVSYLSDEIDQLVLAYATTIHKAQGSEYPAVIIPLHTQHWIMLQRNLLYTAVTRARQLVCLVGSKRALARAVRNSQRARRYSGLREFIARGRE